jgi:mono/diheme cytochrome c family protein
LSDPERRFGARERKILLASLAGLFVIIQLLPVGAPRTNPPVTGEPQWDTPRTRELFFRSCGDCHSNETVWPWYSRVAPVSWLVAHDVAGARDHLNVSEWTGPQRHADEAAEEVREGAMPLPIYLPLHSEARLSESDKAELVRGLIATFGERERRKR